MPNGDDDVKRAAGEQMMLEMVKNLVRINDTSRDVFEVLCDLVDELETWSAAFRIMKDNARGRKVTLNDLATAFWIADEEEDDDEDDGGEQSPEPIPSEGRKM